MLNPRLQGPAVALAKSRRVMMRSVRTLNERRGKMIQAIVFYSVTWLYVIVWASTVWGDVWESPEEERRYLIPLGGLMLLVDILLVPKGRWQVWCRQNQHPDRESAVASLIEAQQEAP